MVTNMRCSKQIIISSLILVLTAVLMIFLSSPSYAFYACEVGRSHNTIQEAIDDHTCTEIYIPANTYFENIKISRNVSLIGEDKTSTIIDGNEQDSVVFISASAFVTLKNLTIQNGQHEQGGGIRNEGKLFLNDIIVKENTGDSFRDSFGAGIYTSGPLTATNIEIFSNHMISHYGDGYGAALYCQRSEVVLNHVLISQNTALQRSGKSGGVFCEHAQRVEIKNSIVADNQSTTYSALYFDSVDHVSVFNTQVIRNTPSGIGFESLIRDATRVNAVMDEVLISENGPKGGLLVADSTTIELFNSLISSNENLREADYYSNGAAGGGIRNEGKMTIVRSTITDNVVDHVGGGISNLGEMIISESTISYNRADYTVMNHTKFRSHGGGIHNSSIGTLFVDKSTIAYNYANEMGGGLTLSGKTVLINTTISNNQAEYKGGGIEFYKDKSVLVIVNGTIYRNQSLYGAGLAMTHDQTGVDPVPFLFNTVNSGNIWGDDCDGFVYSLGYNLDGDNTCHLTTARHDLIGRNPLLFDLADNGGPTLTHLPRPKSPLIDNGFTLLQLDQRGKTRPFNARNSSSDKSDIGAVEFHRGDI